ncbi:MAG TPA: YqgE/AlgH family protein [Pirellulales bacterium]|nr:YqgE/AlgH family protein [Pirellulales bacterium]
MKSLEGQMLVAALALRDPNFHRSVVLIVKHSEEGTLGLVVNRPSGTKIAEIWDQVSSAPCHVDQPIHTGGPIQGPLMALHSAPAWSEIEIVSGLYFTAARESLEQIVSATEPEMPHSVKFFVGYSGWGPGQLEAELDSGAWLTIAASQQHVFAPEDPWQALTRQIGGSQLLASLGIKHVPSDPRLN